MAISKALLEELEKKRAAARAGGGEDKLKARRAKGLMTARDRLAEFYQTGTFQEWGMHADHDCHNFGLEKKSMPGDGVVTGHGTIDGRQVCVFAQDATVYGGSMGEAFGEKTLALMDLALKTGCPVIGLNDGGGARIQEGVTSLALYAELVRRNVQASGVIPQISVVLGPCAGGAAYSPAITASSGSGPGSTGSGVAACNGRTIARNSPGSSRNRRAGREIPGPSGPVARAESSGTGIGTHRAVKWSTKASRLTQAPEP